MRPNLLRQGLLVAGLVLAVAGIALIADDAPAAGPARAQELGEHDRILVEDLLFRAQQHFIQAYFNVDGRYLEAVLADPELTFRSRDIYERYTRRGLYAEFTLARYRLLDVQFTSETTGFAVTYEEWDGDLRTLRGDVKVGIYWQGARHVYALVWTEAGWKISDERVEQVVGGWQSGPLVPTPTLTATPPATAVPTVTPTPGPGTPTAVPGAPTATPTATPAPATPGPGTATPAAPAPTATPAAATATPAAATATPAAATATPTTAATPTITPTPTFVAGPARLTTFDGRANPERVVIQNTSGSRQNLGGWQIRQTRAGLTFVVPAVTEVDPGQQITILSGSSAQVGTELRTFVWTNSFVFNDDTDGVQLINPNGQIVDARAY